MDYDVVVIGGGPAGMSAGLAAYKKGVKVAIIERSKELGGILNQCIHNGFGLHYYKEELTGPEYANRFIKQIEESKIDTYLNTTVLTLNKERQITAVNSNGLLEIDAKSIVLAMGCRERTASAIQLLGTRPSGIYTAGMAQKLCNMKGFLVGKRVVILGSGDIGLIMARRMTYEGAKVIAVLEIMDYSGGLKRNIVQCLEDYNIPLLYSHTVTEIVGKNKLDGIYIAPVQKDLSPIFEKEKFVECDCLLLSVGLIPENDLVADLGIKFDTTTGGAVVNDNLETSAEGIFSCGNVLHVHDLVDNVTKESEIAGKNAAKFVNGELCKNRSYRVINKFGIKYALPQIVNNVGREVQFYFRTDKIYRNVKLIVKCGEEVILTKKYSILSPGEMGSVMLLKAKIKDDIVMFLEEI